MKTYDLTHPLTSGMPVYPGTEPPHFAPIADILADHYREVAFSMTSHVGTHIDAPAHVMAEGRTLDAFPPDAFFGRALVVDCRHLAPGMPITEACLAPYGAAAKEADFLLFSVGWEERWGTPAYFEGYPSPDAALLDLIAARGYRGIGIDAISIDPVGSVAGHRRLFAGCEMLLLENLRGLAPLLGCSVGLVCLPLALSGADGAPARIVARLDE